MRLRIALVVLAAAMGSNACTAAERRARLLVEAGQPLRLRAGESAQTHDGRLRVGFDRVTADSRCPKGQQCVWAGDATLRIWLQRGAGDKQWRELHTSNAAAPAADADDEEVQLLRLDPAPPSGTDMAQRSYVATLLIHQHRFVAPER